MGLFFKKKKEKQTQPSQPAQAKPAGGVNQLEPDIPPPPSDLKKGPFKLHDMDSGTYPDDQAQPYPPIQEPKPGEYPTAEAGMNPEEQQAAEEKKGFELPDFDDEEVLRAEQPPPVQKEPEPTPEPEPKKEPEEPKAEYPEPQKPLVRMQGDFLYVMNYLNAREAANEATTIAGEAMQLVAQHAVTSRLKDDKYTALINELNALQENLMLIDTKLFEGM
jgi:hypothetical protein